MSFPFECLPVELAFEILRLASSPNEHLKPPTTHCMYETACALALVSHNIRSVIMPHLLRTVVLPTQKSLDFFLRTLQQQRELLRSRSRLALVYSQLIRRIWSSDCWEPNFQQQSTDAIELLTEVFRKATSIGLTFSSQHILFDTLTDSCQSSTRRWNCKRLTFAGHNPRWNPLTSTAQGQALLRQLIHLTIWLPSNDPPSLHPPPPHSRKEDLNLESRIPNWINRVPFELMPNLAQFAFTLVQPTQLSSTIQVVMYHRTTAQSQSQALHPHDNQSGREEQRAHEATIFREWATGANPFSHGRIVNVDKGLERVESEEWGRSLLFLRSDHDI